MLGRSRWRWVPEREAVCTLAFFPSLAPQGNIRAMRRGLILLFVALLVLAPAAWASAIECWPDGISDAEPDPIWEAVKASDTVVEPVPRLTIEPVQQIVLLEPPANDRIVLTPAFRAPAFRAPPSS